MRLFISEAATIGSEFHDDSSAFTVGVINQIKRMLEHGKKMGLLRDDIDIEAVALTNFGALKEAMSPSFFANTMRYPEDIIPRVVRSQARLVLK
jgi:hypothetical protein